MSRAVLRALILAILPHTTLFDFYLMSPNASQDVGALCAMLGAEGTASADGHVAGFGTGADGSGLGSSNAVKRFAGITSGSKSTNNVIGDRKSVV